jgi:acetyl-CoA carboxylase carboxyl transferase subunit alpha
LPRIYLSFEAEIKKLEEEIVTLSSKTQRTEEEEKKLLLLEEKLKRELKKVYSRLTPFQKVELARHPERPKTLDFIQAIFSNFIELKGDRLFADDQAVVGGLATLEKYKVVVVGHQKGKTTRENLQRNFGMPNPEGYRKAQRLMKLAAKFNLPVVTLLDTPGAYPGIGAEERGQAWAIAECLALMSDLPVPIVSVGIGEGGSGGALAFSLADRLYLLENAYYSVITPEGCAVILWKDKNQAPQAAEALKLTASDLLELRLIDGIIPEPPGGAHRFPEPVYEKTKEVLLASLAELCRLDKEVLVSQRQARWRKVGVFIEE